MLYLLRTFHRGPGRRQPPLVVGPRWASVFSPAHGGGCDRQMTQPSKSCSLQTQRKCNNWSKKSRREWIRSWRSFRFLFNVRTQNPGPPEGWASCSLLAIGPIHVSQFCCNEFRSPLGFSLPICVLGIKCLLRRMKWCAWSESSLINNADAMHYLY